MSVPTPPVVAVLVAGTDNIGLRALQTDAAGELIISASSGPVPVVGVEINGGASPSNIGIVLVGGTDGSHTREFLTSTTGQLHTIVDSITSVGGTVTVVGDAASGATVTGNPVLMGGSDGTDARTLLTDSSGQLKVLVENVSVAVAGSIAVGSAATGDPVIVGGWDATNVRRLLTDTSGNVGITTLGGNTLNTNDVNLAPTVGIPGNAVSGQDVVMVGATNGTDIEYLTVDGSGNLKVNIASGGSGGGAVYGPTAAGSAPANPPVLVGGTDGTDIRTLLTSNTGQLQVLVENSPTVGLLSQGTVGSTVPTSAVLHGASDGTDLRALLVDGNGYLKVNVLTQAATAITGTVTVIGDAANGAPVAGNPVLVAGSDGTDARSIATDATGQVKVLVENSGAIAVSLSSTTITGSVAVTGTFYQATQPVSGTVTVVGDAASGSAVAGNPVLVAGQDGTDARTLLTSATGQLHVIVDSGTGVAVTNAALTSLGTSIQAPGSAVPADVVMMGASDGTNAQRLLVDGSGYLEVNVKAGAVGGAAAIANVPVGNPVWVAGSDGTDIRDLPVGVWSSATGIKNAVLIGGIDNATPSSATLRGLFVDTTGRLVVQQPPVQALAATAKTITNVVTTVALSPTLDGQCVAVTLENNLGALWPFNVCVRVRSSGITTSYQNAGILFTATSVTLFFNVPVVNGGTVDVDIIAPGSIGANGVNVSAAVMPSPVPNELRADNRSLPLGAQTATLQFGGAATLIAAAPASWRILLAALFLTGGNTTAQATATIVTTVNGSTGNLLVQQATNTQNQNPSVSPIPPGGLMLDTATAVTVTWSGTSPIQDPFASAIYDLVPA
jgi:hypothetical protein